MKNLKKVLALVLAFACAFTMFAGAAFTDAADINADNTEAVDLLTTLGIIKGYEDGSFDPEGTVTRAEMAKMIYTIRNGGNDDASAHIGNTTSFTDISGHWAEGYIKYLQNTGIVAGKSATKFDPDSQVTTTEAMKMALALAGYDEKNAGLTGINWATNTLTYATTYGLTDNVASSMTAGCARQDAAQILANCLGMTAVRYSSIVEDFVNDSKNGLSWGGDPISVGYKWMDLYTNVGTLIRIDGEELEIRMNTSDEKDSDSLHEQFQRVGTDYSALLGQKVKVLFNDGKTNDVIGVYAIPDNNVVIVNQNEIGVDAGKIVIDDDSYSVETDGILVIRNGEELNDRWKAGAFKDEQSADVITLIDTDDNNKIDTAYIKTVDVQKVTYVSSSQIIAGSKTYKFADDNIADGVAKDDWVIITKNLYNDNNDLEIAEVSTGSVSATKSKTDDNGNAWKQFQIGDTWYNEAAADSGKDINSNVKPGVDAEYVAVNGIVFYAAKTSAGADKLTDVLFVAYVGQDGLSNDQARVMYPNGDKETINLKNNYVVDQDGAVIAATRNNIDAGFYEYSKSGNTYELIELSIEDDYYGDFTYEGTDDLSDDAEQVAANKIADSADVIVWTADGEDVDFKHITGKQLKALVQKDGLDVVTTFSAGAADEIDESVMGYFTSDVDGLNRASVLAVEYNGKGALGTIFDDISSNANYGFITKSAVKVENGMIRFTVWTGTDNVEVYAEKSREGDFAKGTIVGYTDIVEEDGRNVMTDANAILLGDGVLAGSITGVNTAADTIENTIDAEDDLDAYSTVLYVDSKAGTGIADGKATVANSQKVNRTTYYATNLLVYNTEVAVIDVNEIAGSTYNAYTLPGTIEGLTDVQWLNTRTNDTDEGKAYYGAIMQLSFYADEAGKLTLTGVADIESNDNDGTVVLNYKAGYNKFDSLIVMNNVAGSIDGDVSTGSNVGTGDYTLFMPAATTGAGYTATVTVGGQDRIVNAKTGDNFNMTVTLDKAVAAGKTVTVTIADSNLVNSPIVFVIGEGQTSATKQISVILNSDDQIAVPTVVETNAVYATTFANNNFKVSGIAGADEYTVVLENTTTAADKDVAGKAQTITAKLEKNGEQMSETDYDVFATRNKGIVTVNVTAKDAAGNTVTLTGTPVQFGNATTAAGKNFTFTMPASNVTITIDSAAAANTQYNLSQADDLDGTKTLEDLGYTGTTNENSKLTVTLAPAAGAVNEGTNVAVTAAISAIDANNYIKVTLTAGNRDLEYVLTNGTLTADRSFTLTADTNVTLKSIEKLAAPKITSVALVDQNDNPIVTGGSYATTDKLIVTFDQAMDTSVTVANSLFTVGGTGTGALSAGTWSEDGKQLTFTTSTAVAEDDTLTPVVATLVSADGVPVSAEQVITIHAEGTAPTFVGA